MSSGTANKRKLAARELVAYLRLIPLWTPPVPWRCADCGQDTHAPAVIDARYCGRCAGAYYAWRDAPFGKIRKVPRIYAARWK